MGGAGVIFLPSATAAAAAIERGHICRGTRRDPGGATVAAGRSVWRAAGRPRVCRRGLSERERGGLSQGYCAAGERGAWCRARATCVRRLRARRVARADGSDFVAPFWPAPLAPKSTLTPSCYGAPFLVLCRAPPSSLSRQRLNLFKIWAASEVVSYAALQHPQGRLLAPLALKTRWHHPKTCPATRHRVRPYRLRQICRFYSRGIHTAHAKDSNLSVVWARSCGHGPRGRHAEIERLASTRAWLASSRSGEKRNL